MLNEKGKTGSFLVRESKSQPGNYVLSIKTEDVIKHIHIRFQVGPYNQCMCVTFVVMMILALFISLYLWGAMTHNVRRCDTFYWVRLHMS